MNMHSWLSSSLVAFMTLVGSVCPLLCGGDGEVSLAAYDSAPASPCHEGATIPDEPAPGSGEGMHCLQCQEIQTATLSSAPVAAPSLLRVAAVAARIDAPRRAELRLAALPAPPGRPPADILLQKSTLLL